MKICKILNYEYKIILDKIRILLYTNFRKEVNYEKIHRNL